MSQAQRFRNFAEILLLWLGTTLAFAIYQSGGSLFGWRLPSQIICIERPSMVTICSAFLEKIVVAAVVCGLGWLAHDGAHHLVARNYGAKVGVTARTRWLPISIGLAVLGLFVAGPSADWHAPSPARRQSGLIALAGPVVSLAVATLFFAMLTAIILGRMAVPAWVPYFGYAGFRANALLGLSSLAPIGRFDGAAVLAWNRAVFAIVSAIGLLMVFALGNEHVLQWLLRLVSF